MTRSRKAETFLFAVLMMPFFSAAFAAKPEAQLIVRAKNVRDESAASRNIRVERYLSQSCSSPGTLVEFYLKRNVTEQAREKPIKIPAGEPIGLTLSYLDERLDRTGGRLIESRSCAVSGQFTPTPGATYQAVLSITPSVTSCAITLVDEIGAPAAFAQQPQVCTAQQKNLKGKADSGIGYALRWNLRFRVDRIQGGP